MRPLAWPLAALVAVTAPAPACCPVGGGGKPILNADQAVVIVWDAARQTQHFIRKATFASAADDFGFVIPSPAVPEVSESGGGAFPFLQKLTEPEVVERPRPFSPGCGDMAPSKDAGVHELATKEVAGFRATVLQADTATALVGWLRDHGFSYSPEVAAWAAPYVAGGWTFTALKLLKPAAGTKDASADCLRLSFRTDRPLFPYREPDMRPFLSALGRSQRLLRIYFVSDAKVRPTWDHAEPWTGQVAWAGPVSAADRGIATELLRLPAVAGPNQWYLTEFEDDWPYRPAPADVYFERDPSQTPVKRPPVIRWVAGDLPPGAYMCAGAFWTVAAYAVGRMAWAIGRWMIGGRRVVRSRATG